MKFDALIHQSNDANNITIRNVLATDFSGECGTNVTYTFTASTSELVISGSGEITNYSWNAKAPWYSYHSSIKSVKILNTIKTIGSYAFFSCSGLTNLTIPNSVTTIGSYAFSSCSRLNYVSYNGTKNPGSSNVISGCSQLKEVNVPKNYQLSDFCVIPVKRDECIALGLCGENTYWSLDTCTYRLNITGSGAMSNYSSYSSLPWYSYATSIETVSINDGITSIGNYAFYNSTGLTSVTIPNSIASIGLVAFAFCNELTSVNILEGIKSIGEKAFSYCSSLTSFIVDYKNDYYKSEDGVLFSKNVGPLIAFPCGKKENYEVPNGVTSIGISAFEGNSFLTSIIIPRSVTSIEQNAFSNCTGLESLIYDGLSDPKCSCVYSFLYCHKLKEANVPSAYESDRFCGMPVIKPLRTPAPTRNVVTKGKMTQSFKSLIKGHIL